jgi:Spy/CpxP family protein refolding chaperone
MLAALLVGALTWCAGAVALAEINEQAVKEKTVAKKVKARGAKERMMPAPEVQLKRLAKGLQLTAEQQKKIRPMLKDEYAKLKEIRQDENLTPKQIQAKVEELRMATVVQIKTVLTPEQSEKYDLISNEIKANKQKRMQENRKNRIGTQSSPPAQNVK